MGILFAETILPRKRKNSKKAKRQLYKLQFVQRSNPDM